MNKKLILNKIIVLLREDLKILTEAARTAHAAATHEECVPDNKYDTTGLEASYVAQGQANRAQDIRRALEIYKSMVLQSFDEETPIRLTALVSLEDENGNSRKIFLGPEAGGLKLVDGDAEYIVITPESPLGKALLGKVCDDEVCVGQGEGRKNYTIVGVS
jgi:transcription elongation GreA/GreB family factor